MAFLIRFSAGLLTLLAVTFTDFLFLGRTPLTEGPPLFNGYFAFRTLAITSAACVIGFALPPLPAVYDARERMRVFFATAYACTALLAISALLVIDPALYGHLGLEDGPVEWASAILVACAGVIVLWPRPKSGTLEHQYWLNLFRWCFAAGCNLIALEEISWGQRFFGIATPQSFSGNMQYEINLHNFATDLIENVYYFGSFLYLVIGPVAFSALRNMGNPLALLTPGTAICAAALPLASLNFDMWDVVLQQATFFLALAIAVRASCVSMYRSPALAFSWGVLALAIATSQAAILIAGHTQPRLWDSTEYKELFIAIGLILAGLSLRGRAVSD